MTTAANTLSASFESQVPRELSQFLANALASNAPIDLITADGQAISLHLRGMFDTGCIQFFGINSLESIDTDTGHPISEHLARITHTATRQCGYVGRINPMEPEEIQLWRVPDWNDGFNRSLLGLFNLEA